MNPNTIPWLHYQDIQVDDISLRNQFNSYMLNGQYIDAIRLLRTNEQQLKGKAYISEIITKIIDGLLSVQSNFNDNVNIFLSDLAIKYTSLVENTRNMGEWNATTHYRSYNFVYFQEQIYMAIDDIPNGVPPTNEKYWLRLGLRGVNGADSVDVTVKYIWSADKKYQFNDLVSYDGNLYIALKENVGIVPGTDETTWLSFLITSEGKIIVSQVEPENPEFNTIWFKTETDSLLASNPVRGEFNRFTKELVWEPMYPSVLFTWIEGAENYAPYALYNVLNISPMEWKIEGDKFFYIYKNIDILNTSFVEIAPLTVFNEEQLDIYNALEIMVTDGELKLVLPLKPTIELPIEVKIQ